MLSAITTSLNAPPRPRCKATSAVAPLCLYRNSERYLNLRKSPKCHLIGNEVFPMLGNVRPGHARIFSAHYLFAVPILMAGLV